MEVGVAVVAVSSFFTWESILRGGRPFRARAILAGIVTRSGAGAMEEAETTVPEGEVFEDMRREPEGVVREMDALGVLGAVRRVGVNVGGARVGRVIGTR